ncbi:spliceosome-associated protein CWC15 homolog isoform X1 [Ornithorhynchus anatinus]|uniref:spliceosome-associated protein CWC15 homolog isoform X1 n=1 Tax=Ornithorhynchus anatinus TaxID=9258 RepID=UPI0019D43F46|nr:spliceosome-associated protein CWC15 homolog isoform X1 [Ornithorhynchus anatinus]XP_039770913.1 spliceosome-associated protein CWC15 homolog isoform X1 [Ornithorhynchus anatinus]
MTTAARPTFEPARGGRGKGEGDLSQLSKQYSSRDLPSHTKIKYRQTTQDAPEEVRNRDFRRELEERERVAAREKTRDRPTREHTTSSVSKKPRLDQIPAANLDADDPLTDEDDEDEDLDEESDDDDTAALLAELEKIKKERAEEQARKTVSPMWDVMSLYLPQNLVQCLAHGKCSTNAAILIKLSGLLFPYVKWGIYSSCLADCETCLARAVSDLIISSLLREQHLTLSKGRRNAIGIVSEWSGNC